MKPDVSLAARSDGPWRQIRVVFPKATVRAFLMLLAFVAGSGMAAAQRSAVDQLDRMVAAMRSLSYEGTLVYLHDGRLETMRIVHRIEGGGVHERIESLNGPVRTMTRDHDRVTCRLPDSHPISVRRPRLSGDLLRTRRIDPNALAPHYLVHPLGAARIAGRQTDVVGIIPRDRLRYGYRFYLDREVGLPLKSDVIGDDAQPIEQIMFTSLTLEPVQTPPVSAGYVSDDQAAKPPTLPEEAGRWRFDPLPSGFDIVMYDAWPDKDDRNVEHYILSDGLASVSVYIENGDQEGLKGGSRVGAIHAVGGQVAGHQVTVVGEVPQGTVQAVLRAIRRGGDTRDD
jgi:sigma-E factor negative regulatory protein RseB